jgi:hypothetical protein
MVADDGRAPPGKPKRLPYLALSFYSFLFLPFLSSSFFSHRVAWWPSATVAGEGTAGMAGAHPRIGTPVPSLFYLSALTDGARRRRIGGGSQLPSTAPLPFFFLSFYSSFSSSSTATG